MSNDSEISSLFFLPTLAYYQIILGCRPPIRKNKKFSLLGILEAFLKIFHENTIVFKAGDFYIFHIATLGFRLHIIEAIPDAFILIISLQNFRKNFSFRYETLFIFNNT